MGALVMASLVLAGVILARRTLPQVSGTTRIPGLHGPVMVVRDRWGVPHIYATNDHDLFAAQGYITAQDRLWQMLLRRQAARGQLSAWLGQRAAQADGVLGGQDFYAQADSVSPALDVETRADLDAYALGVNECLRACPEPPELLLLKAQGKVILVESWTATDSLALTQMFQWAQSQQADVTLQAELLARVGTALEAELNVASAHSSPAPPSDPAVRQALSWIGLPLMHGEPPLVASAPGLPAAWYMVALHESSNIVGATWPSLPGVLVDQTASVPNSSPLDGEVSTLTRYLLALPPEGWLQFRVHGMLRQWDFDFSGKTRLSNASAAVYQVWLWRLARDTFQDELGPALFNRYWATMLAPQALARLVEKPGDPWWDDVTTPQVETRDDIVRRSYAEALTYLGRHYGDLHTIWEWDAMHAAQFLHPLDAWPWSSLLDRTIKLGGDAPFDPDRPEDPLNAYAPVLLPSLRITDQGFALAGGQSGHPFSSHYADLLTCWARGQSVPLQDAARAQDLRDVEGVLTLAP